VESRDSGEVFLVERVHVFQPFSAGKAGQAGIGEIDIEFRVQNDRFFKNASAWHLNAGHVQYGDRFLACFLLRQVKHRGLQCPHDLCDDHRWNDELDLARHRPPEHPLSRLHLIGGLSCEDIPEKETCVDASLVCAHHGRYAPYVRFVEFRLRT